MSLCVLNLVCHSHYWLGELQYAHLETFAVTRLLSVSTTRPPLPSCVVMRPGWVYLRAHSRQLHRKRNLSCRQLC